MHFHLIWPESLQSRSTILLFLKNDFTSEVTYIRFIKTFWKTKHTNRNGIHNRKVNTETWNISWNMKHSTTHILPTCLIMENFIHTPICENWELWLIYFPMNTTFLVTTSNPPSLPTPMPYILYYTILYLILELVILT